VTESHILGGYDEMQSRSYLQGIFGGEKKMGGVGVEELDCELRGVGVEGFVWAWELSASYEP